MSDASNFLLTSGKSATRNSTRQARETSSACRRLRMPPAAHAGDQRTLGTRFKLVPGYTSVPT